MVVIGASAGGLDALSEMVQGFQQDLGVTYCIVLHLSRKGIGDYVVHRLQKVTQLPCSLVVDGEMAKKDCIYIARPNQHMLINENKFILGGGPEENRFRPSIDVLFRSAAVAFTSYTIGVILTGLLDDGTSGMWAIKRSGGLSIVQDPNQAEYPDMPLSIINNMDVDYVLPLDAIGAQIAILAQSERIKTTAPNDIVLESEIAQTTAVGIEAVEKVGDICEFACPDCGGNLWALKHDVLTRYRCHIGHAYTERDLVLKQSETASATLWVALRMMEERKHLLKKMEMDYKKKGYKSLSVNNAEKQITLGGHIEKLKEILFDVQNQDTA